MRPDVIDLNRFYASGLGQVARRMIRRRIRDTWPNTNDLSVLGLGFATPFLRPFRGQAERVVAVMPANQGVVHWPEAALSLVSLAEEDELPFADASFDLVLMIHALETSERVRPLLREVWRVMTAQGRLLAVVPNRRGIWAHFERSPFGHGHPYSPPQVLRLLRDTMFSPGPATGALYLPPVDRPIVLRTAPAFEKLGGRWLSALSGVLIVEATKQIYAVTPERARRRRRLLVPLPRPTAAAGRAAARHSDRYP